MSQEIQEAMKQWEREKQLRRKLKKQDNLLTELAREVKELKEGLIKPPQEETPPQEEIPPTEPQGALEIEADMNPEIPKSGLSKFWDNLKAPGKQGRQYRQEKRNARRQNQNQKPPVENPQ